MSSIMVTDLSDNLPFGARISGVTLDNLQEDGIRTQINEVFVDRGMIVFEDVEPSNKMQVTLSEVFGPLQDHALKDVPRADDENPGLVEFQYADTFEVDGVELAAFVPWHFDACYAKELNRGGVLRALVSPPEGGLTRFADGIQLYDAISPDLRERFETLNIIYHSHLMFRKMRFGRPASYKGVKVRQMIEDMLEATKDAPRSVHPAIWTRPTGEKVLHVSPWQAAGIEGHEDEAGDTLLEQLCSEMYQKMRPYEHKWKLTDMVIWDNWRFIHAVSGHPPKYPRQMQRTTIKGDYGLGRQETEGSAKPLGIDV
ncbi:MAG TPA: TauD/TfdA family dioxygenase [Sphingobium sp.]|uniref:TauD/TfdA dioxygenase family protein n=1 Tax=Sphingobium sp. TaxID=1912891 RepID=UPI002ED0BFCF